MRHLKNLWSSGWGLLTPLLVLLLFGACSSEPEAVEPEPVATEEPAPAEEPAENPPPQEGETAPE